MYLTILKYDDVIEFGYMFEKFILVGHYWVILVQTALTKFRIIPFPGMTKSFCLDACLKNFDWLVIFRS